MRLISVEAYQRIDDEATSAARRACSLGLPGAPDGHGGSDDGYESYTSAEHDRRSEAFHKAFSELIVEALDTFIARVSGIAALCPTLRLFAADNVVYLDCGGEVGSTGLTLPTSCETLRLRRTWSDQLDSETATLARFLEEHIAVVAVALGDDDEHSGPLGGLPLDRFRHLQLGGSTGLEALPNTSRLVTLGLIVRSGYPAIDLAFLRRLAQLRAFTLRVDYFPNHTRAAMRAAMAEILASAVRRVHIAVRRIPSRSTSGGLYLPRSVTLADYVQALTTSLAEPTNCRQLVIESQTAELADAADALVALRTTCDALGMQVEVETTAAE